MPRQKQPEPEKETYQRIARAIREVGRAGENLRKPGLTQKAIIVLLAHATKQPQHIVKEILEALPDLPRWALTRDAQQ